MNIPDPYVNILEHMQSQGSKFNPPSISIGKVISSEPLVINIGDLPLTKANFLVADYLLSNYSRDLKVDGVAKTYITQNGLNEDDMVACLSTSNEQTYIILCKVVSL